MRSNLPCPNCQKPTFKMEESMTKASCSECGYTIDYEKIPMLSQLVNFLKDMKKGISFELDAKDLKEVRES